MNRGLVDEPVFAFRLGSSPEDGGEATFGGIDNTAYKGNITYAPVRRQAYWEVELNKIAIGDEVIQLRNTGAAIDTGKSISANVSPGSVLMRAPPGTSLLALPPSMADMINARIGAKQSRGGQYTVNCSTIPNLPDFTFYLGGRPYPIKATDYILNLGSTCLSSFTPLDVSGTWIVGECIRQHRTRV